jgi:hypothetical protein
MTKRLLDVFIGLILVIVVVSLIISSIEPYLPIIGLAIMILIILALVVFTIRFIGSRSRL